MDLELESHSENGVISATLLRDRLSVRNLVSFASAKSSGASKAGIIL